MIKLKLRMIGNSLGLVLPKAVVARWSLKKGDTVYLTEVQGEHRGTLRFALQMDAAQGVMKRRRLARAGEVRNIRVSRQGTDDFIFS
jgi:antitoxin component of MazEF toxin-antitoxin module